MKILPALQLSQPARLAIVGSGGKTTALFQIGRQMAAPVVVTTSTHLGIEQAQLADAHFIVSNLEQIQLLAFENKSGLHLVTGQRTNDGRWGGLSAELLGGLNHRVEQSGLNLLIEADGSRGLPLKCPAAHEPAIPPWVTHVMVVAGLSGLGQPLSARSVHRFEKFAAIAGISEGALILPEDLARVLLSGAGGLKNIPDGAKRIALLNQADTDFLKAAGQKIASRLAEAFDSVIISALRSTDPEEAVSAVYRPIAGIILAAGGSSRFGSPKALLTWHSSPFVHTIAQTALQAGLNPVIVVTGEYDQAIRAAVGDLPVQFVTNQDWQSGQASSIKKGLGSLPGRAGAVLFLLVDQPQVSEDVIRALFETHRQTLAPILIPQVDGRRGTPVLFGQQTFQELSQIEGDAGGRQIFPHFQTHWLPWNDQTLLLDVDRPEDYQRLLELP
jgi:molybdenum cofactor cytidylyltransferase